ncbi:MAG: hypothetical protein J6T59_04210 [Bacteroidales bacterium]|nr:hypothetical protein [Bacteroidales bacterium]MBO7647620.1 hypothetical protein [Bacteroidales bacterium]
MMKTRYTFSSGDTIEATPEELQALRAQYETYLQNYLELYCSMEDDDYVARGNGFCDSKFSESFLDAQIEKYRGKIKEIDQWLKNQ